MIWLQVPCPSCGSSIGEACHPIDFRYLLPNGNLTVKRDQPHGARLTLAMEEFKDEYDQPVIYHKL
jgi:hypothetical protein